MTSKKLISKLSRFASFLIIASAAIFLSRFVISNFNEIKNFGSWPSLQHIFASLALILLAHGWSVWLWKYSLRKSQVDVKTSEAYQAWSVSRLARYIPGKVFSYIARARLHKTRGTAGIISASVLEAVSALAATAFVGLASALMFSGLFPQGTRNPVIFLCIVILVGIFFLPFVSSSGLVNKIKIIRDSVQDITVEAIFRLSVLQVPLIALHGTSFFIILVAQTGVGVEVYFYIVMAYYLAALLGQAALLSPAGIGVKEAGLIFLLTPAIPNNEAALLYSVIIIRLLLVASECIHALTAVGVRQFVTRVRPH